MNAQSIIRRKRDGGALSPEEIRYFLTGYVAGQIPEYQAAALVTTIFLRGLEPAELSEWTRAMLESGSKLDFTGLPQPKVDKHSTGGVGDKVSIPLAPAVAACGVAVPMISGRGLGHTGGTLDKLESIPGFRTQLDEADLHRVIESTGVAFGAQTEQLVPADRLLYRLRDAISMVESIPLIASSILSKKLAEGLDALVLDVKYGSGAFITDPERGRELARTMLGIASSMGLKASVFQTAMDRPLGRAVGHALEIQESIECLGGGGPPDLRELVLLQGGEMLRLAGRVRTREEGRGQVEDAIRSGRALGVFELVIRAQGGDPRVIRDSRLLPTARCVDPFRASRSGLLAFRDCRKVGYALIALGGGRAKIEDRIDPGVGIVWRAQPGEIVREGQVIAEIHHNQRGLEEACGLLEQSLDIGSEAPLGPLVLAELSS